MKREYTLESKKTKKKLRLNNIDFESNNLKRINSENNIKIKKIHSEPKLSTSKINKYIKKSKSSKFIYMNRIKEKSNYDTLIKFNNIMSASTKMKKIEINKINDEIDNLCDEEIDFYLFCNLLFHFGLVNIKHEEKYIKKYNEIDNNTEIIDNLLIRTYFDENMITKEFIINEINLIKKAFKSIHNDFKIQKYKSIRLGQEQNMEIELTDINYSISIQDFKLFIFFMTNLFEGLDMDDIMIINEKKQYLKRVHKLEEENKIDFAKKENETNNDKLVIYYLIKKLTSIKKIELFTSDFINEFKSYFNYMIKTYEDFIFFRDVNNKEIHNKQKEEYFKNPAEFTFKPTINKIKRINYIKENMKINIDKKNQLDKSKKIKNYNSEIDKLFPFKPEINSPDLKKVFDNSRFKKNSSKKEHPKHLLESHYDFNMGFGIIKDLYKENKTTKESNQYSKKKNVMYDLESNYNEYLLRNDNIEDKIKKEEKKKLRNKRKNHITHKNSKTKIKSVLVINIKNAKNKPLIIYPESNYKEAINKFCLENQFDSNQYMKILEAVRNKISQDYE